jgi:DNA end-binding protein Ku
MARALWTGSITFGLVNIPVKLYKATQPSSGQTIRFHLLHDACGTRLQMKRWCPKDEVEVPWEHVVKGYEVSKGRYVRVDKEELDEILPREDWAAITIDSFARLEEVDPIYYDRAYYVAPEGSPKAYALLHKTLVDAGRVAIARVTLRTRSHLAVVRALPDRLLLSTMFYADEIVSPAEVPALPSGKGAAPDRRQAEMAARLVDSMTEPFAPERYHDVYAERVHELVQQKVETGAVEEPAPIPAVSGAPVVNLLEALKRSLADRGAPAAEPATGRRGRQAAAARPRSRSEGGRGRAAARGRAGQAKRRSRSR